MYFTLRTNTYSMPDRHAESYTQRVSVHPTRIKSHMRFQFVYLDFAFSLSSLFVFLCIDRWSHLDRHDRIETHNYARVRVSASLCEHLEWSNAVLSEFIIKIWFLVLSNPFNLLRFRFPTETDIDTKWLNIQKWVCCSISLSVSRRNRRISARRSLNYDGNNSANKRIMNWNPSRCRRMQLHQNMMNSILGHGNSVNKTFQSKHTCSIVLNVISCFFLLCSLHSTRT